MSKESDLLLKASYERAWIDPIDLTPSLALRARFARVPDAGPGLWIESACPSSVAPRGWRVEAGASVPNLPKKWSGAPMERLRREAIEAQSTPAARELPRSTRM